MGPDGKKPGIITSRVHGQTKVGTYRLTGNHKFGDDKCPGGRQSKLEEGESPGSEFNLLLIMSSLQ